MDKIKADPGLGCQIWSDFEKLEVSTPIWPEFFLFLAFFENFVQIWSFSGFFRMKFFFFNIFLKSRFFPVYIVKFGQFYFYFSICYWPFTNYSKLEIFAFLKKVNFFFFFYFFWKFSANLAKSEKICNKNAIKVENCHLFGSFHHLFCHF